MGQARNNPKFFEPVGCSECGDMDTDLMKHKYTDEIMCVECVNKKLRELEVEENNEEHEISNEWDNRGFNSANEYAKFITAS